MWEYSEKVKELFFEPKNAKAVVDANAVGDVGSISCGDALRLTLRVNPETEVIEDAGFQTFGCGSAIASSSALTELIKGKTLAEALKVSNQDIADYLDGLPPEKMHCSVMGQEALQAAVANYRGEQWQDDHEEGALVCKCYAVDAVLIENVVRQHDLKTVEQVTHYTKAGGSCAACHEGIEEIIGKVMLEKGETPVMDSTPAKQVKGSQTLVQRVQQILKVLEEVRPQLKSDGGDIELVEVKDEKIFVRMQGACGGCQMAGATLGWVQQRLVERLGEFVRLIPVNNPGQRVSGEV
ncbi:Fe-S cluster assembly protein NifU [Aestuariirhabdus litorea]|uniref:Nitrogen fixation protein NifU n=1 Tax=Aestuariirhabdus litorea TaxID=2528527 RepID=A0A3P3VKN5_9GAMM|nr:Fe-S cluster assembly protein NifU [Aestuariirhabdus litorea]RRJ82944.1 Fe-S cluster assembly protein NifU [Aestuariirhabdus litorea]RWW93103.1 Fe-S cluster assembly protein NifU [Endozoicomonadaceae bacterium GTF-13]